MKLLKQFIQQETVLTAAAVLAVVSAFFCSAGCAVSRLHRPAHAGDFVFPDDGHGRAAAAGLF